MKVRPLLSVPKNVVTTLLEGWAIGLYHLNRFLGRPPSLATLANYHASDKGTLHGYGRWPFRGNDYARYYELLFAPRRSDPIALLEIGIGIAGEQALGATVFGRNSGGASLKMWCDYFSQGAIYGLDINPAKFLDSDRVRTFVGDQSSSSCLRELATAIGRPLDIVIDDGSHASRHQQISLAELFPHVSPGGLYVIEDLLYQPASLEGPADAKTLSVLEGFIATGAFVSPFVTRAQAEYLASQIKECTFAAMRRGSRSVAFLRKR